MSKCCHCGEREATWPERVVIGGIANTQIYCQLCADAILAMAAYDFHAEDCDRCRKRGEGLVEHRCREGQGLYDAYRKAADAADGE